MKQDASTERGLESRAEAGAKTVAGALTVATRNAICIFFRKPKDGEGLRGKLKGWAVGGSLPW